ncbi:hypothetical protein FRC01_012861 [Tulasnella sp. 417]|nr:hypothetical protein FRC01_012861 [Tulasnella sp. 417]
MTFLRDKVLYGSTLQFSTAKILAMVDQWNAPQPVSQLPLELIALTVALGFPITECFTEPKEGFHYMKTLTYLATVSRAWRNAILGTPSLWGLLSTSLPPHINHISLQRSGACSLIVGATTSVSDRQLSNFDEVLDIALPRWNRWSHASLALLPFKHVVQHLSSPAPLLEKFRLWLHNQDIPQLVPIDLFGGHAPRLQDISVYGTPLVWDSEIFQGLRKLNLEGIANKLISSDHILGLLAASPSLELLAILDSDVGFGPLPPSSTQTPVQLSNLGTIIFVGISVEAVVNILPFICAPNCGLLQLETYQEDVETLFDTADYLRQSLSNFDTLLHSAIAFHGSSQLSLWQHLTEWQCSGANLDAPGFVIDFPFAALTPAISWISQYLEAGLSSTHQMDVTFTFRSIDPEDLVGLKTLAGVPNVRTFTTDLRPSSGAVLDLLGSTQDVTGLPTFPALEVLQLVEVWRWLWQDLEMMLVRRYEESNSSSSSDYVLYVE